LLQRLTRENQERRREKFESQEPHWQLFNFFGRLVGIWFLVLGGILFLGALFQKDWLVICFAAVFPICGVLLISAKPYRPDLRGSNTPEHHEAKK
jgi:hypothetical protein